MVTQLNSGSVSAVDRVRDCLERVLSSSVWPVTGFGWFPLLVPDERFRLIPCVCRGLRYADDMKRTLAGQAAIPGGNDVLKLYQGKDDCTIVISGKGELMSTRKHASEDALGTLPCNLFKDTHALSVLIGGLGMGFTLAAVLAATGKDSTVVVAELVPEVVEWNRGLLGSYSNHPLSDSRTSVYHGDVCDLLREPVRRHDIIALDVDNGPEAFSSGGNNWLYSEEGIACAGACLRPGGVLAYWSATPDPGFARLLRKSGFQVSEKSVFAHGKKGTKHTIWLARHGTDQRHAA